MMTKTTNILGDTHEIQKCTLEDIESHFSLVQDKVELEDQDAFKYRMEQCVDAGTAFHIDQECLLYYLNYRPCCAIGAVLYGKGFPIKLLALITGVFKEIDPITFKIDFYLHDQTFVDDYKSILTFTSLKRRIKKDYPLVVRVDHLRAKLDKLYKARGIEWVQ